jgi:signal transduction histidine kinase
MTRDIAGVESELDRLREENRELRRLLDEAFASDRLRADAAEEKLRAMARSNVEAAELLVEVELKTEELKAKNAELARANADAAELMAQLQITGGELKRMNEELSRTNEEKNRLLGMISHDIGNGITMIGMSADALARLLGDLAEQPARMLGMIRSNCKSLVDLLSRFLDISRIYEGKMEPHFRSTSVGDLVREIVPFFSVAADGKSQVIAMTIEPGIPNIPMDRSMIHQVITNLLSNAIKFSPEGGKIAVHVLKQEGLCTVQICDSGPGLTAEDHEKLFGAFCQLSAKPTGGEKSYGLGLAISKRLVEIHRGTIGAKVHAGGGACFFFSLPIPQGA